MDLIAEQRMPSFPSQEVAVLLPLVVGLVTTLATIAVHAVALAAIIHFVRREFCLGRAGVRFQRDVAIVAGVTVVALTAHLVDLTVWALVLDSCGEFARLGDAFYHSAVNYSSLGYGDIVMSNSWKLLGALEAANGLLMFGVSTSMIFAVAQQLVQTRFGPLPSLGEERLGNQREHRSQLDDR